MTTANQPVAILAAAGFEERHLTEVQKSLLAEEIATKVISPDGGLVQGWHDNGWGHHFMADDSLAEILSADFSALIVPSGDRSVASLKQNQHTVRLAKAFADADKPMVFLGDSGALLVTAEIAGGRRVAATESSRDELDAAGAEIVDEAIVLDRQLMTTAADVNLNDFLGQLLTLLGEGDEAQRAA